LVDFDPDGLGILSTYKHGSQALAHENKNLVSPHLRWIGIRSSDIISTNNSTRAKDAHEQGFLRLSQRDRKHAMNMLEQNKFQDDCEAEWRRELQVMLMLNIKAEIQILNNGGSLADFLDMKLASTEA
jgi:meiotic recombination protein SPO11